MAVSDIKKLRDETLAGMMACKKALQEADGDFTAAKEYLKVKGLSIVDKKSSREASDGLVAALIENNDCRGVIIELNSETDFLARSDKFQDLVASIANCALKTTHEDLDALKGQKIENNTVQEEIQEHIAILGENLKLTKFASLSVEHGVVSSYIHSEISKGLGKMAAIVVLESTADKDKLKEIGKKIAMHVVASKPLALSPEQLPQDVLAKEKELIKTQVAAIGKPEAVIEKIVNGKMNKYYSAVTLLKQKFVMDDKITISDLLNSYSQELGAEVKLTGYKLVILGAK